LGEHEEVKRRKKEEPKKMKYINYLLGSIGILLFGYLLYTHFIPKFFFREKMDRPWVEELNEYMKKDIIKITIYTHLHGKNYKVIITDKGIIEELKKNATFDYGTKNYSGHYEQFYSIQVEMKDGEQYMFGFNKIFTSTRDACKKIIEYDGRLYRNPYNDCGQISIYVNPYMSESELINDPIPAAGVAGYNLKLIGFIEKYADNIPFDGKHKVPFYNKYDLRKLNRQGTLK